MRYSLRLSSRWLLILVLLAGGVASAATEQLSQIATARRWLRQETSIESDQRDSSDTEQSELIRVIDHWYYKRDSPFDAAAIVRNESHRFVGDIKLRIGLFDGDTPYYQRDVVPDKQILAPGEESFAYTDNLRARRLPQRDKMPTDVKIGVVDYQVLSEAEYPYIEPPEVVYSAIQNRDGILDGMRSWLELKNPGPFIYSASDGDPNHTGPIGAHYPYLIGAAYFKNGKMVSIDRPLTTPRGHQLPGDSTFVRIQPWEVNLGQDRFDSFRLFFTAKPMPSNVVPTSLIVDSMKWRKVTAKPCGIRSECPGLQFDVTVRNASNLEIEAYIGLMLRDASQAPLYKFQCFIRDATSLKSTITIPPLGSHHCSWMLSEIKLRDYYPPPSLGMERRESPIDDVEFISVHPNSMTAITNDEPEAPIRAMVKCYRASDWAPPKSIIPVSTVYLPSVAQETRRLCDETVP